MFKRKFSFASIADTPLEVKAAAHAHLNTSNLCLEFAASSGKLLNLVHTKIFEAILSRTLKPNNVLGKGLGVVVPNLVTNEVTSMFT